MSAALVLEVDPGPDLHAVPTRTDRPACSPRHRGRCSADHLWLVESYRDARDAREALRESGSSVGAAHSYGSDVAAYQLEPDDFAAAYPPVTFRDWLVGNAGRNRHPEETYA
jgi:hypothetical protein